MLDADDRLAFEQLLQWLRLCYLAWPVLALVAFGRSAAACAALMVAVLTTLHELGVQIAVDGFGTGCSSLAYLKRLPVDGLKIDKSFIQHVSLSQSDAAIVRSTIGLGHDMRVQVVAEGVEDQATWDTVSLFGCDLVQGFFLCRPVPAAELGEWLPRVAERVPTVSLPG